jgi:hypothetical protein
MSLCPKGWKFGGTTQINTNEGGFTGLYCYNTNPNITCPETPSSLPNDRFGLQKSNVVNGEKECFYVAQQNLQTPQTLQPSQTPQSVNPVVANLSFVWSLLR